ncbi:peptidase M23 [Micromonospora acroterricola]|uniref:Peptidase M23 n=1 Tax=Micromonospora acroterricola TaxID=2202421 RepID=A0A317CXX9_9ACTN|nr:peptidase M23 [Micromonospora acroterricola]PWR07024.1 peptidase M23 [Micromonospora acroterricola]
MRDDGTLDDPYAPSRPTADMEDGTSAERTTAASRLRAYARDLIGRRRAQVALATGVVCCLGLAAVAQVRDESAGAATRADARPGSSELMQRAEEQGASRGLDRAAPGTATPSAVATPADPDTRSSARKATTARPTDPAPVAGLDEDQMENAEAIVRAGREMGVPRRGLVIAVATAMQESNLYNVASGVLPESRDYPHQGVGWDHDSVGLFQQRSSSGWGPVGRLMDPEFATRQFLTALEQVPGWQHMRLTDAAQAVQVSAYPEHYQQHEWRATRVVSAILPSGR